MTKDQKRGRRQTDARALFRQMAESAKMGAVSRCQLMVLAQELPQTGMVNATEALLLATLIGSTPAEQYEAGGKPIVFKSNRTLAFEIGKCPNHAGRLLSRLFDVGLVSMQDSANYKRYAHRGEDGELIAGAGIDLRVLVARHGELSALVRTAKAERKAREAAWSSFRGAVRQLDLVLSSVEDIASRVLSRLKRRFAVIMANVNRGSHPALIERAARLCRWLAERAHGLSQSRGIVEDSSKMLSRYAQNVEHIHNTNIDHPVTCSEDRRRPADAGQVNLNGAGCARRALGERMGAEKSNPAKKAEPARNMHIGTLTAACPTLATWLGAAPASWAALIDKYPLMCVLAGISPDARDRAAEGMGQKDAAMAAALILERNEAGEITSAGGFMRALTERAAAGVLHLEKSIYARARSRLELSAK